MTSGTLVRALHRRWSPKHLPTMRDSDGTLYCVFLFFFLLQDTERWLRSTEEAKCRLNVQYKHCKLLFHCWGHQWNVPTGRAQWGATPKTRGLYYSQVLGLPVWLPEPPGTLSILDRITYHVLLYTILFSVLDRGRGKTPGLSLRPLTVQLCSVFVPSTVSALPSRVNLTKFEMIPFSKKRV